MENYSQATKYPVEELRQQTDILPLSVMTDEATYRTREALQLAYKINQHLFGIGEPMKESPSEPKCYRDVLSLQVLLLDELYEEICKIAKGIGI